MLPPRSTAFATAMGQGGGSPPPAGVPTGPAVFATTTRRADHCSLPTPRPPWCRAVLSLRTSLLSSIIHQLGLLIVPHIGGQLGGVHPQGAALALVVGLRECLNSDTLP